MNQDNIDPQNRYAINQGEPKVSQIEYEQINSIMLVLNPNIKPENTYEIACRIIAGKTNVLRFFIRKG